MMQHGHCVQIILLYGINSKKHGHYVSINNILLSSICKLLMFSVKYVAQSGLPTGQGI